MGKTTGRASTPRAWRRFANGKECVPVWHKEGMFIKIKSSVMQEYEIFKRFQSEHGLDRREDRLRKKF